MRKHIITMKDKEGLVIDTKVVFTPDASFDAEDSDISLSVAAHLFKEKGVADYIFAKKIGDRFSIADIDTKILLTGFICEDDEKDYRLIVTKIYGDVFFVESEAEYKIK